MGKAGYRVVSDIFGANTSRFGSAEDRAEYVAENLKNFNFLYKYLQETVSTILWYRLTLISLYCRASEELFALTSSQESFHFTCARYQWGRCPTTLRSADLPSQLLR